MGYAHQQSIDYNETFAPVTKMKTIHVLLAVAIAKGWHLHQMDICKECIPTKRVGGMSVHGTTPQISVRNEHFGSMPIEEVPLQTKASPVCLEREDHAMTASDGF